MSATPPLTAKEIIDIVLKAIEKKGDLHARIMVARKVTVPGQAQYSSEGVTYSVEIDVPPGEKIIDAVHKVQGDLEVLIGEFKGAHLTKRTDTSYQPSVPRPNSENRTRGPKTDRFFDIAKILQPDQIELVDQTRSGNILIIKPKRWLGNGLWDAMQDQITAAGGKWVSAGENSHWEIAI